MPPSSRESDSRLACHPNDFPDTALNVGTIGLQTAARTAHVAQRPVGDGRHVSSKEGSRAA
jgi:hypothetical protein